MTPRLGFRHQPRQTFAIAVTLVLLDLLQCGVRMAAEASNGVEGEVARHVEMGKKLMAAGQLADALTHFHAAIDKDDDDYMVRYWRATAYLAVGKSSQAVADLDEVIKRKPDFVSAILQRGSVHQKQGSFEEARNDFNTALKLNPNSEEARNKLEEVAPLDDALQEAETLLRYHDFAGAVERLNTLIESVPWDPKIREMRADAFAQLGQDQSAISDLRHVVKLVPDSRATLLKMSKLCYAIGQHEESLEAIRQCLRLDADDKRCKPHYTLVKKLTKQFNEIQKAVDSQRWGDCVMKSKLALQTESSVHSFVVRSKSHLCHCYRMDDKPADAVTICSQILNLEGEEKNLEVLVDRGEAHLQTEDFDAAIADFQAVLDVDKDSKPASEGLKKAQRLKKQAGKRNYYKILGVKKTASKKEINKAYKKLAAQWHPDRFQDEKEKESAQKKFIDIAAAKEVLTDEEKRSQFDAGVDPLDPEAQQEGAGGGGNPFYGGFPHGFGGGGGGGGFKFHFRT